MSTLRNRVLGAIAGVIAAFALLFGLNAHQAPPTPPMRASFAASPSGALAVANTAVNGTIGGLTAAQTVDNYSSFVLTQTSVGDAGLIQATLPTPTNATAGRQATVSLSSVSTQPIELYGVTLGAGSSLLLQWDGAVWGPAISQTSPVIVYQQGGSANPAHNVYSTWATAYAAAAQVASSAPTIVVDATYGTPTIPAGTWAIDRWTFQGASYGSPAYGALQVAQGAVLTVPSGFVINNLTITSNATGTSPITNQNPYIYLINSAALTTGASATVPFISCASGTGAVIYLNNSSMSGVAAASVLSGASGSFAAVVSIASYVNAYALTGTGPISVYLADTSSGLAAQISATLTVYPALGTGNSPFLSVAVTLTAGTATVASGKNLTQATLLGCKLTTATTAVGTPIATFVAGANGNVTVTSKTAAGATATTDASTYSCLFAGAY